MSFLGANNFNGTTELDTTVSLQKSLHWLPNERRGRIHSNVFVLIFIEGQQKLNIKQNLMPTSL